MASTLEGHEKMMAVSDESALRDRLTQELPDRWARVLPGHPELGRQLIARYAEPQRRYHDGTHLVRVLMAVDALADEADDVGDVVLAAWFHDAVYDVRAVDNEEQSARLAETELARVGVPSTRIANVARLVRLTAAHAVEAGDRDGAVLCDADLSILAAVDDDYREYAAAVREEYAHVPEPDFRAGRAAILRQLLALPRLFATQTGHDRWEARARRNVEREIAELTR
jgi:predicted metal-dependent HD superfamily phosphohydrolase